MIRCLLFIAIGLLFSSERVHAQKPPMSLENRIQLATKLIAEDRAAAIKTPSDSKRTYLFTEASALIDPKWTAEFILSNPIDDGQANAAYENKAIRRLLSRPELLTAEQVTKLAGYYPFMSNSYIRLALDNLPEDAEFEPLKDQLNAKALQYLKEAEPAALVLGFYNPSSGISREANPVVAEEIEKKIKEYYTSGKAEKAWKQISKRNQGGSGYQKARLKRMAPEGFELSFLGDSSPPTVVGGPEVAGVLEDKSLSDDEKTAWLAEKTGIQFGTDVYDAQFSATRLGRVAEYDLPKALAWAQSGKSPVTEILGKLSIAPVLARTDKPAAIKLVRECYDWCLSVDLKAPKNRGDMILLNTHPVKIATSGLKIAKHIDAELLADCIKDTLELIERELKPTQEYARMGRVFRSLAGVAQYDHKAAKAVFDRCTDEVQLHSAADFFVALAAIDPESVWEEYSTLPLDGDSPHDKARFRARQAIASALAEYEDEAFWTRLAGPFVNGYPDSIFEK